ncbi:MAG: ATP-binding protein [Proteobacteria bacterium]|nr:ATP-binding protein [Pseudomonadota bacterium]
MRQRVGEIVLRTSERVAAAVRGLMTFSRKREGTARRFDLVAWLDTLVHELGTTLPDNVGVRVQGAEGLMVDFGADRLRQLVVNLVLNGADALAANGGEIRISALPVVDEAGATIGVDLVIEDNGVGMTAELATRAREVFFTTKDDRHAGLGLTIAIGIVEQAGRTLQLASAPGVGTRVTVPLLATREPPAHPDVVLEFLLPDELPVAVVEPPTARVSTPAIVEPSVAPDRWIDQMTTRHARVGAAIVALACGVLAISHATYLMLALMPLLAMGGWAPGLQRASRVLWFGGALIVAGFASIALLSYLAGTIVLLVAAIVWIALFAPRWILVPVLAVIGGGLLGIGWLFHVETLVTPAHVMTTHPTSLILSAIVATLLELAIVQFVLATVDHAQRGVMSMRAARRQLQAAQDEEDAEGVRQLQHERDVTRSERMAATGRAVSTVAHDLNNALFGLMSAAEELAVPELRPDEIARAIEDLWGAFNHARALALQFAVTDEVSPVTTVVDVSAVVQRTLRALQSIVGGAIALDTEVASGCFVAIADDDLRRLLFNLVTNARDSIAGAGTVTVTLRAVDDDRVRVDVRDTGRGMDEATRARLSEAFFTTKPEGQGTGLGLHSVARIVARTHGQLAIDSTPGCGTNVTVSWPAATTPGPTVAPSVRAVGVEDRSEMIGTVIVAEDEPLVRALLVRTLERAGYVVRACEDGDRALAVVDELATCVALCIDGVMPGRPTADVLCSGHLPADLQQRGLLGPGVTFLAKPFSPGRLRDVLANLVGSAT